MAPSSKAPGHLSKADEVNSALAQLNFLRRTVELTGRGDYPTGSTGSGSDRVIKFAKHAPRAPVQRFVGLRV